MSERPNRSKKWQNGFLRFGFYNEITPAQYEMSALVANRAALQAMPTYPSPRVVVIARKAANAVASTGKVRLFRRPVLANAGGKRAARDPTEMRVR